MRQVVLAVLVLIGTVFPVSVAYPFPAPKLTVEVVADNEAKISAVMALLSAVRKGRAIQGHLVLDVRKTGDISARMRISPETPYSALVRLNDALKTAGVQTITIEGK